MIPARSALPFALAAALLATGCRSKKPTPESVAAAPTPAAGPLLESSLVESPCLVSFAVYTPKPLLPSVPHDVQERVHNEFPEAQILSAPVGGEKLPAVIIQAPDIAVFAPPTDAQLQFYARGLDRVQKFEAARSKAVLVMTWKFDFDLRLDHLRDAQRIAFDVASKASGTIFDESTGQLFGTAIWKTSRMDTWDGTVPDIRQHIGVHIVPYKGKNHLVTFGMSKFGLPDLVVLDLREDEAERTTKFVEAVAQLLVEGQSPSTSGKLDVDVKKIRHSIVRPSLVAFGEKTSAHRVSVALVPMAAVPGLDPENRLVAIGFGDVDADEALDGSTTGTGMDAGAYEPQLATALTTFFGPAPSP
jgi:hypothetical protein